MSCKQEDLNTAVRSRDKLIGNIERNLSTELIELFGKDNSVSEEIECLELELQHRNEEIEYLKQSQKKMKTRWKAIVERMEKKLNEQNKQLQHQLTMKTQELKHIREQLQQKENKLEEKIAVLEKKSALVKQLQEEVVKLTQSYMEQQQELNLKRIESTAYSLSCEKHLEEVMVRNLKIKKLNIQIT